MLVVLSLLLLFLTSRQLVWEREEGEEQPCRRKTSPSPAPRWLSRNSQPNSVYQLQGSACARRSSWDQGHESTQLNPTRPPLSVMPPALEFLVLDSSIDSTTQEISSTLRLLVANASARVTTLYQLNRLRIDRERVLDLEEAVRPLSLAGRSPAHEVRQVQARNAEMLVEAKRELERQERWEVEIREVLARAEEAGEPLDLKEVDEVVQLLGETDGLEEFQRGSIAKLQVRSSPLLSPTW